MSNIIVELYIHIYIMRKNSEQNILRNWLELISSIKACPSASFESTNFRFEAIHILQVVLGISIVSSNFKISVQ